MYKIHLGGGKNIFGKIRDRGSNFGASGDILGFKDLGVVVLERSGGQGRWQVEGKWGGGLELARDGPMASLVEFGLRLYLGRMISTGNLYLGTFLS